MAQNTDHATPPQVPSDMLVQHKRGWHEFTRFMLWNAIGIAAVLFLMLLFFRVF